MNLVKGNLCFSSSINPSDIEINTGSVHHSQMNFDKLDFPFRQEAYVPKNNWRPLNEKEVNKLFFKKSDLCQFVHIGRIDDEIIQIINEFKIHSLLDRKDVINKLKNNEILLAELNTRLNKFVENISEGRNDFEFHRLSIIPSGRYVTSINLNNKDFEYIGLHIDHSTLFEISTAHLSRNRVCINIGNEDRYLYILNLALCEMKELLSKKMNINKINVENIVDYFFKYFADYPVLKIRQKPFEYYIAPTDNYVHDGSTYCNRYLDMTITYLGKFCF
ncbi:hypothetical protein PG326_10440 [Riemerella anatipestifer]|nr:hypothetical protein [Riemerella anatipestifer]MDY3358735.1 hypothetical protein [Riemerella anatipestifer]